MKAALAYAFVAAVASTPMFAATGDGATWGIDGCEEAVAFDELEDHLAHDGGWLIASKQDFDPSQIERLAWIFMPYHFIGDIPQGRGRSVLDLQIDNVSGKLGKPESDNRRISVLKRGNGSELDLLLINWRQVDETITIDCKVALSTTSAFPDLDPDILNAELMSELLPDVAHLPVDISSPEHGKFTVNIFVVNHWEQDINGLSKHAPHLVVQSSFRFASTE